MQLHEFRLAETILSQRSAWSELESVLRGLTSADILAEHRRICSRRKKPPAGGQTAINSLIRRRLLDLEWIEEPRLFADSSADVKRWKMDFIKDRIGVEVAFNHLEAVAWNFTKLNLAGEAESVSPNSRIDVGVAVFATKSLKDWCKMDGAVGNFDQAKSWLALMRPVMPIPIMVVGLDSERWRATRKFRGTRSKDEGTRE